MVPDRARPPVSRIDDGRQASEAACAATAKRIDRRIRKSRRAIIDGFERLIAREPLECITVSAIAREADVDRKTFYEHFGTIDGLLDALAEDAVTRMLDAVELRLRESGDEEVALEAFFHAVTDELELDLAQGRGYCENVPGEILFDHLRRPFARQVVERRLVSDMIPEWEIDAVLSFVFGGLFALYRYWTDRGGLQDLDDASCLARQLVRGGLTSYIKDQQPYRAGAGEPAMAPA